MTAVTLDRFCAETTAQTRELVELLGGADLSAPVPTCPGWSLADLLRHIGGNLRTVGTAVRTGRPVDDPATQVAELDGPSGTGLGALAPWLTEAADAFAAAVRAAEPAATATVWGFGDRVDGWARRAAHDIAVHRADAALAIGADYALAPELAADAVDELLDMAAAGMFPGLERLAEHGSALHLHATDTVPELRAEWLLEFGAEGFGWRRAHQRADTAVRGPLTELLLVLYRRRPATTDRVEVIGSAPLLDAWLQRVSL
ncbi:maleylpyruvate isomerase family mycothiol-dependent enzyme [Allonocardiopsis opalescens]|uniref:Uncharacterized protein (TIGR03083 family) n=1 Tax=Allonocardiopsis opalescens TaxID=1144618 RepID=A0A2T0Q512_9ACTN|nr:maleylpyruvate isomerase family mycothiol-dependent enzyme [Allonocardiopsis opalescens]PRX98897.1 uncharacterized protein (TIGR03083 family) [Allonocardiopsis opalescens]